ncbi:hypothetical protein COCSUDRAFT_64482 [Coccomyxa subellipsoidea C-169]|uniref:RING-type domain-containing protein n=1 Tax=Coccomyxa subellipsoidea (strain C-169) TaxID=574566 RepID=I0Z6Z6_COCSC|nr:hypothetical protein COCSUDRAFT_64482 [Coccomyxa subellipsoidea C-169]EIE26415.1 hypothetical protein COCSUDRAFT_64482 [Coccomyxa subellipsoidea C-169]|eukprot:XP_005650959.1 hypothetical protein COCSUDRAFT_64482 [Coccomyxa subellipsoidea C-169]
MQNYALSVFQKLYILSILPHILGLRAPNQLDDFQGRDWQPLGARNFAADCVDVSLLLSAPLEEYAAIVSQSAGIRSNASAATCLLTAEVPEYGSSGSDSECESHVWDVRESQTEAEPFTQQLRLHSTCNMGSLGLQVMRHGAATKHRRLADSSIPAANATLSNQTGAASPGPGPGGSNGQGPSNGIACCCGQNNQVGGSSQCCCGPVTICCQASGFCLTQNCTAIFVGSTLIAGALISFMTCGICIYRARANLQEPATFWTRSGGRFRDNGSRQARRPLPTHAPPDDEEGTPRECPVCLEETTSNAQWVVFGCHHATCRTCYDQLVAKPHQDAACPLCRRPLTELVPETTPSHVAIQMQPLQREPAGPSGGQVPASAAASGSSSRVAATS